MPSPVKRLAKRLGGVIDNPVDIKYLLLVARIFEMKIALKFALLLFGLVIAVLTVEVGLRVADKIGVFQTAQRFNKERPRAFYLPDPGLGTKDRLLPREKHSDTFRIVVVGDSFTFAPIMQFDDAFSKRLERFLNLNFNPEGDFQHAEVLNLGHSGFNAMRKANLVREALRYNPDLIILQITLNDAQRRPVNEEPDHIQRKFGRKSFDSKSNWIVRNSSLARLVAERLHNQATIRNYINYHNDLFRLPASRSLFEQALNQMVRNTRGAEQGVPLVAVVFPLFDFEIDENYPFAEAHDIIASALKEREIPHLDLTRTFSGIPVSRLQLIPFVDSHPNEIAHRIAAERILGWLVRNNFVPRELAARRVSRARDNVREPIVSNFWKGPARNRSSRRTDPNK